MESESLCTETSSPESQRRNGGNRRRRWEREFRCWYEIFCPPWKAFIGKTLRFAGLSEQDSSLLVVTVEGKTSLLEMERRKRINVFPQKFFGKDDEERKVGKVESCLFIGFLFVNSTNSLPGGNRSIPSKLFPREMEKRGAQEKLSE